MKIPPFYSWRFIFRGAPPMPAFRPGSLFAVGPWLLLTAITIRINKIFIEL